MSVLSRLWNRWQNMRVMTLSRYIRMAAATMCAVCLLVASSAQAVNVNKEKASKEVVMSTTNIPPVTRLGSEGIVDKQVGSEDIDVVDNEVSEPEKEYISYFTEDDAVDLAKVLLRECGGVPSKTERACVAWCVLNRVDEYESSVYDVLREPNQFAFSESTEVRNDLYELAEDVLMRWNDEKNGILDSGRVLPREYMYFHGDGVHNYFRNAFSGDYDIWDYSIESPYEN